VGDAVRAGGGADQAVDQGGDPGGAGERAGLAPTPATAPDVRQPAPAEAIQPSTSTGLLRLGADQHPAQYGFETHFERKRAEGKRHEQAVLALARRRVNVLWAMLRDDRSYEERLTPSWTAMLAASSALLADGTRMKPVTDIARPPHYRPAARPWKQAAEGHPVATPPLADAPRWRAGSTS
jgi:hypothetical protein